MPIAAVMFEDVGFAGRTFSVNDGENTPIIPPPLGSGDGQASSLHVFGPQWITFWESPNFDEGDDSLWIAPPNPGFFWPNDNLHTLPRPHGTNHWGDRIRGVSFSGEPTGSNENRTIIHPDGHITVGNFLLFSPKEGWSLQGEGKNFSLESISVERLKS